MKKIIKKLTAMALVLGVTMTNFTAPVKADAVKEAKNPVSATQMYSISGFELIWKDCKKDWKKEVINSFYLDGNTMYVTVRYGSTVYVARCEKNNKDFNIKDFMKIKNCGHGQTLEKYNYNNKTYFLVSANYKQRGDYEWSLEIGRVQYSAGAVIDANPNANDNKIHRMTNIAYANKNGTKAFDLYRADGAVSADGKYLGVWGRGVCKDKNNKEQYKDQYSYYDFKKINELWDSNIDIKCNSNSVKKVCKFSKIQKHDYFNSSFQGMDITNAGNFYVSSSSKAGADYISYISSGSWTVHKTKITCGNNKSNNVEIESAKISGDNLLFAAIVGDGDARQAYIYSVAKNKLQ